MPIPSVETVVLPPVDTKTLEYIWIRQIIITTPSPLHLDQSMAVAEYGPWSGDMAEDAVWRDRNLNDLAKTVRETNIYELAEKLPSVKTAMSAIRVAVADIINYQIEEAAKAAAEAEAAHQSQENSVETEPESPVT